MGKQPTSIPDKKQRAMAAVKRVFPVPGGRPVYTPATVALTAPQQRLTPVADPGVIPNKKQRAMLAAREYSSKLPLLPKESDMIDMRTAGLRKRLQLQQSSMWKRMNPEKAAEDPHNYGIQREIAEIENPDWVPLPDSVYTGFREIRPGVFSHRRWPVSSRYIYTPEQKESHSMFDEDQLSQITQYRDKLQNVLPSNPEPVIL